MQTVSGSVNNLQALLATYPHYVFLMFNFLKKNKNRWMQNAAPILILVGLKGQGHIYRGLGGSSRTRALVPKRVQSSLGHIPKYQYYKWHRIGGGLLQILHCGSSYTSHVAGVATLFVRKWPNAQSFFWKIFSSAKVPTSLGSKLQNCKLSLNMNKNDKVTWAVKATGDRCQKNPK